METNTHLQQMWLAGSSDDSRSGCASGQGSRLNPAPGSPFCGSQNMTAFYLGGGTVMSMFLSASWCWWEPCQSPGFGAQRMPVAHTVAQYPQAGAEPSLVVSRRQIGQSQTRVGQQVQKEAAPSLHHPQSAVILRSLLPEPHHAWVKCLRALHSPLCCFNQIVSRAHF